jgi:hypothetical protein
VSDLNPADLPAAGSRVLSDEFTPEPAEEPEPPKREREGLPPGYRMRADPHYVEQLTSRRAERAMAESPRARKADAQEPDAAATEARDRRELRDRRSERLVAQLAEDLATIESSAALVAGDASPAARRVNVDLVRAHAWRAAFLLRAHALLDGSGRHTVRARAIGSILARLRDGLAPECRLTPFGLHVHAPDWNANVSVDESVVSTGLAGAVLATLAILDPPDGATVKVAATVAGGELRAIEVTQDEVGLSPAIAQRFFDPTFTDRPGGWLAAVAAAAARAAAQQHGGEAVVAPATKRGSTIRLTFARTS